MSLVVAFVLIFLRINVEFKGGELFDSERRYGEDWQVDKEFLDREER